MFAVRSIRLCPQQPGQQQRHANEHRERIVIEVTGLDSAENAGEPADRVGRAVDDGAVDDDLVALVPQEVANATTAGGETLDPEIVNDVFNIGAKEFTTLKEDYQAVLDYANKGKRIVPIPAAPAIWTLRLLEKFNLSPLYKWVYETVTEDSFVSIEKAEEKLGYKPKYSNKDAMIRNYQWYIDHLADFSGQSGVSHRVPWKQGALGVAKMFF